MDQKAKRKFAWLCYLPNVAFLICGIYYLIAIWPLVRDQQLNDHIALATITARHYDILFVMMAISAIMGAVSLIYCLVHLARIKGMNGASKLMWIVVLCAFMPVSLLLFYYMELRREPRYMETYPDIA